jgi:hypothetical protein
MIGKSILVQEHFVQESNETDTLEGQCKHCLNRQNQLNNTAFTCMLQPTLPYMIFFSVYLFLIRVALLRVSTFYIYFFQSMSEWVGMTSPSARCMGPKTYIQKRSNVWRGPAGDEAKPWASFAKLYSRSNRAVRRWMKERGRGEERLQEVWDFATLFE